jgi:hypothetical protein
MAHWTSAHAISAQKCDESIDDDANGNEPIGNVNAKPTATATLVRGGTGPYPCPASCDSSWIEALEATMARSKTGQAIRESQCTAKKLEQLNEFLTEAVAQSDLATWRRGRAVLGYIQGKSVKQMTGELDVSPSAVKKGIRWYDAQGVQGLWTRSAPGARHRFERRAIGAAQAGH